MAQEEQYGNRPGEYSAWHRRLSTQRFVGIENAQRLAMIDLDAALYVEYNDDTKRPLVLVETAIDNGQLYKTATVTKALAVMARVPALVVLYKLSDHENPGATGYQDIVSFRVKQLTPNSENGFREYSPQKWCEYLLQLRDEQAQAVDKEIMMIDKLRKLVDELQIENQRLKLALNDCQQEVTQQVLVAY